MTDSPTVDRLDDVRAEYANTGMVTSDGAVWLISQVVVLREQLAHRAAASAVSAAVPPTTRTELRDRIRRVLAQTDGFDFDSLEPHDYQIQAAAIEAVLPPPADRAAVVAEAADALEAYIDRYRSPSIANWAGAVAFLRRLAAEAPATTPEALAEPPSTCWQLEMLDGMWAAYGPLYADHADAVAQYRSDSEKRPTWSDVSRTPVQRRIVRRTTTYTVEQPDTETRDAPPVEPHPTEADLRHALAVAAKFHGQNADQPAAVQTDEETNRVVAYRSTGARMLRCLTHAPEWAHVLSGHFTPVTSEDLPDGGHCTFPGCDADVLIQPQTDEEA